MSQQNAKQDFIVVIDMHIDTVYSLIDSLTKVMFTTLFPTKAFVD